MQREQLREQRQKQNRSSLPATQVVPTREVQEILEAQVEVRL